MSETPQEQQERSTGLMHTANALFPAQGLAPWMSIIDSRQAATALITGLMQDLNEEIERRYWMDQHQEQKGETEEQRQETQEEEFDMANTRGAAGMLAFALKSMNKHMLDLAPSIGGIGRKQAVYFGAAQKSGVAIEPKKRGFVDKITGRGKDKEQITGGSTQ